MSAYAKYGSWVAAYCSMRGTETVLLMPPLPKGAERACIETTTGLRSRLLPRNAEFRKRSSKLVLFRSFARFIVVKKNTRQKMPSTLPFFFGSSTCCFSFIMKNDASLFSGEKKTILRRIENLLHA